MPLRWIAAGLLLAGCAQDVVPPPPPPEVPPVVREARILFGHQSVGRNVLEGARALAPDLRIVDPSGTGPAIVEIPVGANGDPASKDRSFLEALSNDYELAGYKYCYVDFTQDSTPELLFEAYARTLDEASGRGVAVMAITAPLTVDDPAWKRLAKRVLGRPTARDLNARRGRFNDLVRERFGAANLFDLARLESTLEDGRRHEPGGIEALAPAFTHDGAHLNERGRRHVAAGFIEALGRALD
jgi:hypothetical protein